MKRRFLNRILPMVIVIAMAASLMQSCAMINSISVDNILENGRFENGLEKWGTYFYNNSGSAQVTKDHMVDIKINKWETWSEDDESYLDAEHQILLNQKVNLKKDKTYTLQFDAYASEKRAIGVEIENCKELKRNFNLTTTLTTYSITFTPDKDCKSEFQFLLGYIDNIGYLIPNGEHNVFIGNVFLVEGDGSNIVIEPSISQIEDGVVYNHAVTPDINCKNECIVTLFYKENKEDKYQKIDYQTGNEICSSGYYKLEAVDSKNKKMVADKEFGVDLSAIDYNKQYYLIKSRLNSKIIEVVGAKEDDAVIQSSYSSKLAQLFSVEEVGKDTFVLRSLLSDKVISLERDSSENGVRLVQKDYKESDLQKWKKERIIQGYVSFLNIGTGKAIDVPSASSEAGIQLAQYEGNRTTAQQWDLVEIDAKKVVEGSIVPDTSTIETWQQNAIVYPKQNKLTPAGPIYLQWHNNKSIGDVESYEIRVDNKNLETVKATDEEIMEYEWYSTSVDKHTLTITAIFKDGKKIASDLQTFFVTKKGTGWGTLYRTEDMNLSWYYHWSTDPSAGTDEDLQFVPMLWGNWGSEWLNNPENKKYKTILGFNEPDFKDQSNVSVKDAVAAWKDFTNSGLRTGSPSTAIPAYWSKEWFWKFMNKVNADENLRVDFITVHCYIDSGDPDAFIDMIDKTWETWHKPIWITEFGVAEWKSGIWNKWEEGSNKKVYEFMKKVLPALDEREFVERYAWFPFDPEDIYGGSSGLFDYSTGELNKLGKLYARLGVPEAYFETISEQ